MFEKFELMQSLEGSIGSLEAIECCRQIEDFGPGDKELFGEDFLRASCWWLWILTHGGLVLVTRCFGGWWWFCELFVSDLADASRVDFLSEHGDDFVERFGAQFAGDTIS